MANPPPITSPLPYRLGDFVIKRDRFTESETAHYQENYPESLGVAYLSGTQKRRKYSMLSDLVEQYRTRRVCDKPCESTLSIHLRLGDRVGQAKLPTAEKIAKLAAGVLERNDGLNRITLLYGNHLKGNLGFQEQSDRYIETLESLLVQRGSELGREIEITKRIDQDADEDFVYLANSKFCILTIGGFSALAGILCARRGGSVYLSSYRGPAYLTAQIFYSKWIGRHNRRLAG